MVKFLDKFLVHSFIHNPRRGKIGVILSSSNEKELHIGWLGGKKQIIKLNPGNRKDSKELNRIKKFKVLEVENFCLYPGLPTRILKIVQGDRSLTVKTESICIPGQTLDDVALGRILLEQLGVNQSVYSEVETKKVGDTLKGLVRFWA